MRRSSNNTSQLAFDWAKALEVDTKQPSTQPNLSDGREQAEKPRFEVGGGVIADTARRAGRLNAANISIEEEQALLAERQRLLDRKFAGSITQKESNRLEYVRWSLDRIEDARSGQALDHLEDAIARYEGFLQEIMQLREQIERATGERK